MGSGCTAGPESAPREDPRAWDCPGAQSCSCLGHGEPCNSPWAPAELRVPPGSLLTAEDTASHNLFNAFKEKINAVQ